MARIRSVHPGIWTDEAFVSVSRDARLLFIGLLNECDDHGAFEWKPLQIKMRLAAGDDAPVATVIAWLGELESMDLVKKYESRGSTYGAVRHFRHWQRPKKPTKVHPMTQDIAAFTGAKGKGTGTEEESEGDDLPTGGELVGNRSATTPEIPPQMEETLGKMDENQESKQDAASCGADVQGQPECDGRVAPPPLVLEASAPRVVLRGTRLPKDWKPDEKLRTYCTKQGVDPDQAAREFVGYWVPKAGRDAIKLDWGLTFQNSVCRLAEMKRYPLKLAATQTGATRAPETIIRTRLP